MRSLEGCSADGRPPRPSAIGALMNAAIEVFFTEVNQPWSNADPGVYHVNVFGPDGTERIGVPAPDGYASIDLPPGRYMVVGTLSGIYVNFDSNETLVNVGCNQRVCVSI